MTVEIACAGTLLRELRAHGGPAADAAAAMVLAALSEVLSGAAEAVSVAEVLKLWEPLGHWLARSSQGPRDSTPHGQRFPESCPASCAATLFAKRPEGCHPWSDVSAPAGPDLETSMLTCWRAVLQQVHRSMTRPPRCPACCRSMS